MTHKKGEILVLSSGEYSDYYLNTLCKVLKDFDEHEITDKYSGEKEDYNFDGDSFVAYLIKEKYIKEINYVEWNFESYGKLEFSYDED